MLAINQCQISHPHWQINLPDILLKNDQMLVISGPSGMGKSTFLHWLLGDTTPHVNISGSISIDRLNLNDLSIEKRRIGLLMQDIHLFPHLTVLENICFALPRTTELKSKQARRSKATEMLLQIDLGYLAQRFAHQLSGGEKARVGLVRALANSPKSDAFR